MVAIFSVCAPASGLRYWGALGRTGAQHKGRIMGMMGKLRAKQKPTLFGSASGAASVDLTADHGRTPSESTEPENAGSASAGEAVEPIRTPPPSAIVDGRCADGCGMHRERWAERDRGQYADRLRVECRRCGKFIGYKMKEGAKQ